MPIHKIMLKETVTIKAQEVVLDSDISLGMMKKMQHEGLMSKTLLNDLMLADKHPEKADLSDMFNAAYICYKNAGNNELSQEQFEMLLPNDFELMGTLYGEMLNGSAKRGDLVNSFKKVTKNGNKNKNKKKHQKS